MTSTCRMKAILVGLHIVLPVFPLVNVGGAEFPVLIWLIDALKESPSLLIVGKVEEYLDNARSVAMKMLFEVHYGAIPLLPNILLVAQLFGQPLGAKNLRMHANNQHFLVIRTVEDADPAAFRKSARSAPKKIMFQLFGTGLFETEDVAAFRIDPGHDVTDGAILAGTVHTLENQQQRISVGRVVKVLQRAQLLHVLVQ